MIPLQHTDTNAVSCSYFTQTREKQVIGVSLMPLHASVYQLCLKSHWSLELLLSACR